VRGDSSAHIHRLEIAEVGAGILAMKRWFITRLVILARPARPEIS
jgi:hypothetical protein